MKPKIAFLVPGMGAVYRGAERVSFDLAKKLKDEFDFTIFCRGKIDFPHKRISALDQGSLLPILLNKIWGLKSILFRLRLDPIGIEMFTFSFIVFWKLLFTSFDLIVIAYGFWGGQISRIIRFLKGTPFLIIGHGSFSGEETNVHLFPDFHIVVNKEVFSYLKRHHPQAKLKFIPNGIDAEKFYPGKSNLNLDLERPYILCVGAFLEFKRIELAIKAVSSLRKGSLILLGEGPLKLKLKKSGDTLLGKYRFYMKYVKFEEILPYYRICDLFTLPSINEPLGLVYLESMACNKPIVAQDDSMRRYIISGAGILCNCENINEYKKALKKALDTQFLNRPREQSLKFSWDKIAPQYLEVIKGILKKNERK